MQHKRLTRRSLIRGAALGAATLAAPGLSWSREGTAPDNCVARENALRGTREWQLHSTRIDPATKYRSPGVEGYASHASVRSGETLRFFVSANPPSRVSIDVYRLGYYAGDGGRLMRRLGTIEAQPQTDPEVGPKRLRNCMWKQSAELMIPDDWLSGVYVAKLTSDADGLQSYVIFIVRDDRPADLLFQCSDHTWQAYNRWPSTFSLYDDGQTVAGETDWHWGPGVQVSFNRPYGKYCQIVDQPLSIGSGEYFLWEFPFAFWLESHGYDVTYISNQDTHRDLERLCNVRGLLSVGHDEYWTLDMFRHVQRAVERGVSVGFFSGNAVCGRIEYDPQVRGFERTGVFGPPGGTREFSAMSSLPHERPYANELVGAHSTGPVTGGADWICTRPDHWIYRDTGMSAGEAVEGLIGWEWHGDPAPIAGLEIVASGPTQDGPGRMNGGQYTATVYPGPKGNIVFNAATCWWGDALSEPPGYIRPQVYTTPRGPDRRVQQITLNILRRMIDGGR